MPGLDHDHAGERGGERCADPLRCGHRAERDIEAARPLHEVGDDQGKQRAVEAGGSLVLPVLSTFPAVALQAVVGAGRFTGRGPNFLSGGPAFSALL
jgi:hypothetical protein